MQPAKPNYWFPAKKFGWGWGLPVCWQGWLVMAIWLLLIIAGFWLPLKGPFFTWYGVAVTVLLLVVFAIKGEKPRWRSGKS
jgi:hypothetical protein